MPVRMLLNRFYVHIVTGMDTEQREKFEDDLYAPVSGHISETDLLSAIEKAALGVSDD